MREYFLKTERTSFSIWEASDIDLAKSLRGDKNLFAGHNPKNIGSEKVLKKLGFHSPTRLEHPSYLYYLPNN